MGKQKFVQHVLLFCKVEGGINVLQILRDLYIVLGTTPPM